MHFMIRTIIKEKQTFGVSTDLSKGIVSCYFEENFSQETLMTFDKLDMYKACFKNAIVYYINSIHSMLWEKITSSVKIEMNIKRLEAEMYYGL